MSIRRVQGFVVGSLIGGAAATVGYSTGRAEQLRATATLAASVNALRNAINPALQLPTTVVDTAAAAPSLGGIDAFDDAFAATATASARTAWNDAVRSVHRLLVEKLVL
jgi:hypothetical protein